MNSYKPKHQFGQNFLVDSIITDQIITLACPKELDHFIEIGPGQGALTQYLVTMPIQLEAIEIDRDLAKTLNITYPKLTLHCQDALSIDYASLYQDKKIRFIGNLPYNIASALIIRLFDYHEIIQDMLFMVQEEVAQRLIAQPNTKNYGRLALITQFYCHANYMLAVSPQAFDPMPKVNSAVVHLKPHGITHSVDVQTFTYVVGIAFQKRRKIISNALGGLFSTTQISSLGIDPKYRPEQLSFDDYIQLSKLFMAQKESL